MGEKKVHQMVSMAMLAAVSTLLMMVAFPVIPAFSFMTVDFSDIPILLGAFLLGPFPAIGIAALRSILHFITTGASIPTLIGDVTSFVSAIVYVVPLYLIIKRNKSMAHLILGIIFSTLSLTIVMSIANYYVVLPLYAKFAGFTLPGSLTSYITFGVVPFNVIKGAIVGTVYGLLQKSLVPWIEKKTNVKSHN